MGDRFFAVMMSLLSVVLIAGAMLIMVTKLAIFAVAFIVLLPFAVVIKWKVGKSIKQRNKETTTFIGSEYHL